MLTRCPHCQTAFRVTSEQLKARLGRVRCGECREVFDALDSLADEKQPVMPADHAPADILPADTADIMPLPVDESAALPADESEPGIEAVSGPEPEAATQPDPGPEPEPEPMAMDAMEPVSAPEDESRPPQDGAVPEGEPGAASAAPPEEAGLPEAWDSVAETAPPRRWPWILGMSCLLLIAAGQLLFIFRVELAVLAPELRPALTAACELVGCAVPRPRKPELVGIETSDLAPAGEERLLLTATLKNRAPFAQEYPHLELTLTDTRDAAILRRVLAPADWLPAGQTAAAGFAARGETGVRLLLDAPGVPAVGYRLYLFYP